MYKVHPTAQQRRCAHSNKGDSSNEACIVLEVVPRYPQCSHNSGYDGDGGGAGSPGLWRGPSPLPHPRNFTHISRMRCISPLARSGQNSNAPTDQMASSLPYKAQAIWPTAMAQCSITPSRTSSSGGRAEPARTQAPPASCRVISMMSAIPSSRTS